MNVAAGGLDRRIQIQQAVEARDSAGDLIATNWIAPPSWPADGRRWASQRLGRPQETPGALGHVGELRQVDTVFTTRFDRYSSVIAPEVHRVVYRARVYEIVGLGEGKNGREDTIDLLCCSRPDQRGSSAPLA